MIISLVTVSCEDFLEEVPVDEIALDQYFTEPEHARDAVNSLYRAGSMNLYPGDVYGGPRMMFGPWITGFVDNDFKGQEVHVVRAQELTYDETNLSSYFNGMWSDLYLGISRANTAIKYIPETPGLADAERSQYLAEAHFFRAMNYFYLVRFFGGVPLITEPYEGIENLEVERSSVEAVYSLIVEDLDFAINSGALDSSTLPNNNGRITQGIAQTILTDVHLNRSGAAVGGDFYAEAAQAARAVISSGVYSLYENSLDGDGELIAEQSAYNKIRETRIPADEYIFYYEYQIGISNSTYAAYSYPVSYSQEFAYAITNNVYLPTEPLLNSYDPEEDLRIQEGQYFHSSDVLPDGKEIEFPISPHMWKNEEALYETALDDNAVPIYTYANVLLMAAEAIAHSEGVTAEAVDYLAQVRERAYWQEDPATIRAELAGLSQQDFIDEVLEERVKELVFEFTLWFDIIRTRKFPVPAEDGSGEVNFVDVVGATNHFGGTFTEGDLLFPIPELEMQRNPSLTQNPGY